LINKTTKQKKTKKQQNKKNTVAFAMKSPMRLIPSGCN